MMTTIERAMTNDQLATAQTVVGRTFSAGSVSSDSKIFSGTISDSSASLSSGAPLLKKHKETPKGEFGNKVEEKREYNRLNAARNRQRQKRFVQELKDRLVMAEDRLAKVARENDILKVQVKALMEQNALLMTKTMSRGPQLPVLAPPVHANSLPIETIVALHLLMKKA